MPVIKETDGSLLPPTWADPTNSKGHHSELFAWGFLRSLELTWSVYRSGRSSGNRMSPGSNAQRKAKRNWYFNAPDHLSTEGWLSSMFTTVSQGFQWEWGPVACSVLNCLKTSPLLASSASLSHFPSDASWNRFSYKLLVLKTLSQSLLLRKLFSELAVCSWDLRMQEWFLTHAGEVCLPGQQSLGCLENSLPYRSLEGAKHSQM